MLVDLCLYFVSVGIGVVVSLLDGYDVFALCTDDTCPTDQQIDVRHEQASDASASRGSLAPFPHRRHRLEAPLMQPLLIPIICSLSPRFVSSNIHTLRLQQAALFFVKKKK